MDPNATLEDIRKLTSSGHWPERHHQLSQADAERLVELVYSLDHWLTNGGFLPREWS